MTQTLFVVKSSQTFSDALVAYGLALVVRDVLARTGGRYAPSVRLSDAGSYYQIDCTPALDEARLATLPTPYLPAVMVRTAKNVAQIPADLPPQALVDYEHERDKRAAYFELRKALPQEAVEAQRKGELHPALEALYAQTPHSDWDVFRALNPAALTGYNKLMQQWWQIQDALPKVLMLLRDMFAQTPNDVAGALAAWKALDKEYGWGIKSGTTASQLYNPAQGKGQNRAKADKLHMDNIKDAFWLLEWLKAVAFYQAAMTKALQGSKDRKTYVLAAMDIDLAESDEVMRNFKGRMMRAETSVRSDVLMSLRYTQTLLSYSQEQHAESFAARLFAVARPTRIVAGFYNAFYKNLGNSAATMNLAFIGLPAWVRVGNAQDVADALAVLEEHEAVARQFDESHSDDVNLLLSYRDFISASDLWPFFEFTTAYASYIISQRERARGRARQFTTTNLRRLFVNVEPKLRKILDTPGFKNIAYAIRQSTVTAQYRKQQGDRRYDVRYGLNQELARKANYPQDFIAALSEFLHKYNAENAQVMERRAGPYRKSIKTTDIEDIVVLVDEFGAPLVCQLLIAYGYARTPREEQLPDAPDVEPDQGDVEDLAEEDADLK